MVIIFFQFILILIDL